MGDGRTDFHGDRRPYQLRAETFFLGDGELGEVPKQAFGRMFIVGDAGNWFGQRCLVDKVNDNQYYGKYEQTTWDLGKDVHDGDVES